MYRIYCIHRAPLYLVVAVSLCWCTGCSNQTVLPTTELTEAQKAAVRAEDKLVEDEESQGKNPIPKKKK